MSLESLLLLLLLSLLLLLLLLRLRLLLRSRDLLRLLPRLRINSIFLCNRTWSLIDFTDCNLLEAVYLDENTFVAPAEPTPVGPRPASVDGDPQVAAVVGPPVQLVHGVLTSTAQPQAAFFLTAFSLQPSGLRSLRVKAIWPWAFKKLCCLAKIGGQQTSQ